MFLLRSRHPEPPGPTLNTPSPTIPDDEARRRARHLRQCERLAELGMELAEAAQREAMKDLEAPLEHRMPGMALPPTCRTAEPGELFTKLSHCVRQAILLEARLAGGAYDNLRPDPAAKPERTPGDEPAPSAAPLRPHRPDDRPRLAHERIEDDLARDTHRSAPEILAGIAKELGAIVDVGQSPDLPRPIFPDTKRQGMLATQPRRLPPPPPKPPPLTAAERAAVLASRPPP